MISRCPTGLAGLFVLLQCLNSSPRSQAKDDVIEWRGDYDAARRDAHKLNQPLVLVIGTDECIFCRKQDASTFRDPALIALLNKQAVTVKVNGNKEPGFVQSLKIQIYPTTIIASPDGKIVSFLQGYITSDQLKDHVRNAISELVTTPDWATRDFADGEKALKLGDAPRALALWKTIRSGVAESPVRGKAEAAIQSVEKQASDRLARASQLEVQQQHTAAFEVYADVIRQFSGTKAASEATTKLTAFATRGEAVDRLRLMVAKEFLTAAKEDLRRERFADCVDRCEQIRTQFPDLNEAREALSVKESIHSDADKLQTLSDQLLLRAAEVQLRLAELWQKKGDNDRALACYEKAHQLAPNTRLAELATSQITTLKPGTVPAATTSFRKNP
ncbi:MAG: DUF255 domain-containing protein [Fimbriiglobus sp.]